MTFGLLNAALLLGLAGLAVPIIIHLLHRRRFEVVEWGATAEVTHDRECVRQQIDRLPSPSGSCDLPEAIREGLRILNEHSTSAQRDIVVLSDGQKYGWADENTLFRWKLLASILQHGSA